MDILPCSMVSYIFQSFLTREIHVYLKLARERVYTWLNWM